MTEVARPKALIPTLDGWRALAIGGVIISHTFTLLGLPPYLGSQGVAVFFAISGFLITTLLLRELSAAGSISLQSFYVRRAFRILPAALTYCLTLLVIAHLGFITLARGEVLASALFISNYWPDHSWYTAHFWSLAIEEHFYLIWPFVLALAGLKRATVFAVLVIIGSVLWRPFGLHVNWGGVHAIQRTDMRLDAFMYAGVLAIVVYEGRWIKILRSRWLFGAAAAALIASYGLALLMDAVNLKETVQSALIPLLVVNTVLRPNDWFSRALDAKTLSWMGRMSYSLYLWQELVITNLIPGHSMVVKLLILCIVAVISYSLIENPFRRFAVRLLKRDGRAIALRRSTSASLTSD